MSQTMGPRLAERRVSPGTGERRAEDMERAAWRALLAALNDAARQAAESAHLEAAS